MVRHWKSLSWQTAAATARLAIPAQLLPPEALQADIAALAEEVPAARDARPEELIDTRYVDELERDGFFARLGSPAP